MFQPGMMQSYPQPFGQPMGMAPGMGMTAGYPQPQGYAQQQMQPQQQMPQQQMPMQRNVQAQSLPAQPTMGGASSGIQANVIQIAGCLDSQQGQDIDVSGLPAVMSASKAGGACTNAIQVALYGKGFGYNYRNLMVDMSRTLQSAGYSQHPQLSSSHPIDLNQPVTIKPPAARRTKSLLIGINYRGQGQGELLGCHNDVRKMQQWITSHGFSSSPDRQQMLLDDGVSPAPTKANIWNAMKWLIQDAQPGDALFFHFSGHGGQTRDLSGDEASGFDQTMIPVDHKQSGTILDDDILAQIIKPLPRGVDMFCIMDCCHSGTIMDLPYTITVDPKTGNALSAGQVASIGRNQRFANKGRRRGERDIGPIGGQTAGAAAMAGGIGLCCADCFDLNGDSDQPGGNNAPGACTGIAMFVGGCCACCVDVTDLCGDSKQNRAPPGQL